MEAKLVRRIDSYFAEAVAASFNAPEGEVLLALTMNATESGNTCLDIDNSYIEGHPETSITTELISQLISKGLICTAPLETAPIILSGSKLYLKAFYKSELSVSAFIKGQASKKYHTSERLMTLLDKYFPISGMQKAAALSCALNNLTVISGGPGTGKTSTVFSLLAVLLELSESPLRIAVCAPTGKAASRLTETLSANKKLYAHNSFINSIPEKAVTIHRMLGIKPDGRPPYYNRDNKLPYDIIVADEASMVDIRMMSALVQAAGDECRLILLGDKDQLASVQPGAVLGDICQSAPVDSFSPDRAEILSPHAGRILKTSDSLYADITVMLDKSYRYEADKGIGMLAAASAAGDFESALEVLKNDATGRVKYIQYNSESDNIIGEFVLEHFRSYYELEPEQAVGQFDKFRILSPHKRQNGGTEHINAIAVKALFRKGLCDASKHFYHGMPLMITDNDYGQNLFNGETGLVMEDDGLKACFKDDSGRLRKITAARLPSHVPAFSMTVHKSQGSEFDHVLFVMPDTISNVLTRELFYTAVTRAKHRLTVISTDNAVKKCLEKRIERESGIFR
jgi:exodeoxyribonuclease V alpha subunit